MTAEEPEGTASDQFQWVIPRRLSSRHEPSESVVDDLHLTDVLDTAKWCYEVRSAGRTLPTEGVPFAPDAPWLRAAHGLAGSVGESLVVCVGCEVELDLHRATGDPAGEIGGRFFSIAASQEIIGIGHRLLNMVQRAVSARPDYRELLCASTDRALRECAAEEDPRSMAKAAWLSLNSTTVGALARALEDVPHLAIRDAVGGLRALVTSGEWRTLEETRGEVFHRSRPESSIVWGLDSDSGYVKPIVDYAGRTVGYSVGGSHRYAAGDDRWSREAAATSAALVRTATAVRIVTAALVRAVEPLTRGRRRAEEFGDGRVRTHQQIGGAWSDEECTCCTAR